MYLIYSVISCLIGILLVGMREMMIQHRRLRHRQERLIRAIREVVLNSGAAARCLTPEVISSTPFASNRNSNKLYKSDPPADSSRTGLRLSTEVPERCRRLTARAGFGGSR